MPPEPRPASHYHLPPNRAIGPGEPGPIASDGGLDGRDQGQRAAVAAADAVVGFAPYWMTFAQTAGVLGLTS